MYKIVTLSALLSSAVVAFLGGMNNVMAATDPTKPFFSGNVSPNQTVKSNILVLESIIHGNQVHTAVINGKLLKVGQYIGDFKLVAVNDKSVVLRSEDERKKLYIFSELTGK